MDEESKNRLRLISRRMRGERVKKPSPGCGEGGSPAPRSGINCRARQSGETDEAVPYGLKYVESFTPPSSRSVLTFYHLGAHKNGCDDG